MIKCGGSPQCPAYTGVLLSLVYAGRPYRYPSGVITGTAGVLTATVLTGCVCDLFVQLFVIVDHCIGRTRRWGTQW
jgi:hypothetical protein